ncbi:hypothetical protein L1887_38906 [Cichorium endivia]|nr:hypothetical protein L1887_38906 [Cichorium endivia]
MHVTFFGFGFFCVTRIFVDPDSRYFPYFTFFVSRSTRSYRLLHSKSSDNRKRMSSQCPKLFLNRHQASLHRSPLLLYPQNQELASQARVRYAHPCRCIHGASLRDPTMTFPHLVNSSHNSVRVASGAWS